MKRILSVVLAIIMTLSVLTSLSLTTFAVNESPLTFELNEDGKSYAVVDCDTNATGLVDIPETYNSLPVTNINNGAFMDCTKIETINIPRELQDIGYLAFDRCTSLKNITINSNPNGIGTKYFVVDGVLFSTENIYQTNNGLEYNRNHNMLVKYPSDKTTTTYTIPANTMAIAPFAFSSTINLNTVIIPATVQKFYLSSFHNYTSAPMDTTTIVFQHDTLPTDMRPAFCYLPKGSKIVVKNESLYNEFTTNYSKYILEETDNSIAIELSSIPSTSLELNTTNISLDLNETSIIIPTQQPAINTDSITFTSSDENIVSLDAYGCGRITANSTGTAIITVKSGSISKNVTVTVACSHKNTEVVEAKIATCTENGYTAGVKCLDCGSSVSGYETIAATGHNTTLNVTRQPNCTREGSGNHVCTICNQKISSESIPALGHKTEWITIEKATCSTDGQEAEYCSRCDRQLSHRAISKTNNHTFTEWVTDTQSTCNQQGTQHRTCTQCGKVETTENPATSNHKFSDWTIDTQPTCTTNGSKSRHCTVCGYRSDITPINASGHQTVILNAVTPTCTNNGLTQGSKCSVCNTIFTAQQSITASGHKNTTINAKTATCTENGYTGDTQCTVCGVITAYGSNIAKTGHQTTIIGATQPTFVTDGYTGDTKCSVCGVLLAKGTVIPKLVLTTPTVTISNTANGINVSWNTIENAQGYDVYRRQYNASTNKWSGWSKIQVGYTSTNYVDGTVVLGTNYRYTVRAVNGTAMSSYQPTATLKFNVIPTVKIANAKLGVTVNWSNVVNATGYTVYRSQYTNGKWTSWKNMGTANASKSAWTDKSVKSGISYKYTVRACYGKVKSSYTASNTVVFLTQPTVKIANASTGIKVAWTQSTGATGYTVYRSQLVDGKWSNWKSMGTAKSTKSSWTDKKVESGATYKYTVRAVNGNYKSTYTDTKGLLYLAQPTVTVKAVSNGINVAWSQCEGATGYTVYRSEYNTKTKKWSSWKSMGTAKADKSNWTDKKATKGVKYKYTVRAVNADTGSKSSYVASKEIKR